MKRKVKTLTVKDINLADYNPRTMSEKARYGLEASMKEFGDLSGITWNLKTKNLITGHQRWTGLASQYKDLFFEPVAGDRNEIKSKKHGALGYFVRIVDWDKNKEIAANISANNQHIQGEFEQDKLQVLLDQMKLDFSSDFMSTLQFDPLIMNNEWSSDIAVIDGVEEQLEGLTDKIIVECPKGSKDLVKKFLTKKISESKFENVLVR